jgi:hypothetical protein
MRAKAWLNGLWRVTIGLLVGGCASMQPPPGPVHPAQSRGQDQELPGLPSKRQVRAGQYLFIADFDIRRDHPLLKELEGLQEQVCRELQLPSSGQLVHVYLFGDRPRYERYMQAHFKNLPPRRAFFMARSNERRADELGDELVVYTYWGDRIQEDLRHELTHAVLHGVLKNVPMWLDEGIAEYFEVPPEWHGVNYRHLAALRSQPGVPWTPDLARLEKLTLVKDMSPADYRESWAWVHLMLRTTPQAKSVLTSYLQQLQATKDPGPLHARLATVFASPETSLREHVAKLENKTRSLPTVALQPESRGP